jgi:hypothetical protein
MEINRIKTRFLVLVFIGLLVLGLAAPSLAATDEILYYEEKVTEPVARGVTYQNWWRFTSAGWLKVHVLEVDLTEPSIRVEPIYNEEQLGTPQPVSQLAAQSGAIAAINGDFFYSQGAYMAPVGPLSQGGRLIASPGTNDGMAVLGITPENRIEIAPWRGEGTVTLPNGVSFRLAGVNKPGSDYAWPILYTPDWGATSPATPSGTVTVTGVGTKVLGITETGQQEILPAGGFALVAGGEAAQHFHSLSPGADLKIQYSTTPNWQKYVCAIGGGGELLRDGKIVEASHEVAGLHPRSAVGVSADGNTLYLVVVDGRQDASRGLEQAELAQLMLDLGAAHALNMDGGNSSTMVARSLGSSALTVKNNISGAALRPVPNGIGIFSDTVSGPAAGLVLSAVDQNIPLEGSRTLNLAAYDANYNPVSLPAGEPRWEVFPQDLGQVIDGVFFPGRNGQGKIKAELGGLTAQLDIRVLGPAMELTLAPAELSLEPGTEREIVVHVTDNAGYRAQVEGKDLLWETKGGEIGTVDAGRFAAAQGAAAGVILARLGELEAHALVTVGRESLLLSRLDSLAGASFLSWPQGTAGSLDLVKPPQQLPEREGPVLQLEYDFTPVEAATRAAYVVLGEGRVLHPKAEAVGIWVYGDGSGHWLRGMLTDAAGEQFPLDFARRVDWQGWRYVRAALPKDKQKPFTLQRIYLTEPDISRGGEGAIYLGNLQLELPLAKAANLLPETQALADPARLAPGAQVPSGTKLLIVGNVAADIDQAKLAETLAAEKARWEAEYIITTGPVPLLSLASLPGVIYVEGAKLIFLQAGAGGLRVSNPGQWVWLLEQLDNNLQQTAFYFLDRAPFKGELPGVDSFTNGAEAGLFRKLISEQKGKNGQEVWVFSGGVPAEGEPWWKLTEGVRYLGLPTVADPAKFSYILVTLRPGGPVYSYHNVEKK